MSAYLFAVVAMVLAVAACRGVEEEAEETTSEETQAEEVSQEGEAAELTTEVEAEVEEEVEAGVYVAEPVVGEIFITSASEINEDNIFKARGLSVWTNDPPNRDSIIRLRSEYPTNWDPDKQSPTWTARMALDSLVRFRADNPMEPWDLRPLPSLATSWEFIDDRTIVFQLRKGVKFHDTSPVNGRELVADDVVYSFERRLRPGGRHGGTLGPLDSITAQDNYTIEFKFKEPFSPFMSVIGRPEYAIQAPEVEQDFGGLDDWDSVIGTGPWYFESYEVGGMAVQVRHEDYWRGPNGVTGEDLPYIQKVYAIEIADEPAAIAAYRSGLLDAGPVWSAMGAWGALKDNMILLLDKPELLYNYHPAGGGAWTTYFYGPRMTPGSPWENKKIRWGVAMYNDISFEAWAPCCGGAQPTRWAALDNPWFVPTEDLSPDGAQFYTNFPANTLDLEKAQQYVREGKVELGLDPDEPIKTTMTIAQPDTAILDIATRIVADLAKIGIEAEIVANDSNEFQSIIAGDFTGLVVQYVTPAKDPNTLFYNRYHSESGLNQPGTNDPHLDELIIKGQSTLDPAERELVYRDIQIYLAEMQYDWAVPNWTNENVFPEWVKNPGPFTTGRWIQDMYLTAWVDDAHPSRTEWEWEE
jgi:peptide/nickel transport system substrate-binding protein